MTQRAVVDNRIEVAVGALRWLCAVAPTSDPETTKRAADVIVGALLDLAAHQRGDWDPRRQRSLTLAQRVWAAHADGCDVAQLCERFGKSRAQLYKLLSLATSRDKFSVPLRKSQQSR